MGNSKEILIARLKEEGYLKSKSVETSLRSIPRENFILTKYKKYAYSDEPLPIPGGQTISAVHMYVIMLELAELKQWHNVLEIGTGSGYGAALFARLCKSVYTVELEPGLVAFSRKNLSKSGISNVKVIQGDGSLGYPEQAPYDRIIITCACPDFSAALVSQLKDQGIIMAPIGMDFQELVVAKKTRGGLKKRNYGAVAFVPMRH